MASKFNILFVASEVAPFAKTGGLADVANSLPKALKNLRHDVRIFMPRYRQISDRKFVLREVIRLQDITLSVGGKEISFDIKSAFLPGTKIQVYFLDYKPYFDRDGLYVDPETGQDYPDNDERFILFNKAAIEILKILHWQADVIHCNDWQSALIPAYIKTVHANDPFFSKMHTLLTIHNIGYQGNFSAESFAKTGLPNDLFYPTGPVEFYGKFSFLKAGIYFSDKINTVSPTYAREIQQSSEYGFGLEGLLRERSKDVHGILNGVDYTDWDPSVDTHIAVNYDSKTLSQKVENKKALLEEVALPFDENTPLIGTVSRLADQKGFDILAEAMDDLMKLDLEYVLLGTGEPQYHKLFEIFQKKYPRKISAQLKFDNRLAHLIEAGSDMFLMPSKYEPCGLNQMYSLRYGTIPIVRKTGGLADTVVNFNPETHSGTGFVFEEYSASALIEAVKRAVETFQNKKIWVQLQKQAMKQDFSWDASAKEYLKLYAQLRGAK
ncbi:MAG: glycogen synthase GlgA [Calditrichaeota bacterium]|nr:glycogen synthase GlgA [Calditrichota bacterium]